jgi:AbrB family looped-hinge helix DNA binding protein
MRTTIDRAGRVVIPKALRESLGLSAGTEIEVAEDAGRIVITGVGPPTRLDERDGRPVLTVDADVPALTVEAVRELIDRGRR